jgi:hypothetical protein
VARFKVTKTVVNLDDHTAIDVTGGGLVLGHMDAFNLLTKAG